MVLLEVLLTAALAVLAVGGIIAFLTRPIWTAAWKRYLLEREEEHQLRVFTEEQRRARAAAVAELETTLAVTSEAEDLAANEGDTPVVPKAEKKAESVQKVGLWRE
ncbi:MAG: hypothetical protein FJX77_16255 [Armatimonadetes bacterium]|nr:hypothetical protein [Armatimonadota bacterium]